MRKTFKYRIYPSKAQIKIMSEHLETCRKLYNKLLSNKKDLWEKENKSISMYEQQSLITLWKKDEPKLKEIHSQVLQDVTMRIDLAFKSFFRRVKSGEKVGYPRFKSFGRYDSLTYKQYGNGIKILSESSKGKISISKIGHVKTVFHRKLEGIPKTAIIKRSSTGKWYISFSCEIADNKELPKSKLNVGVDVGLETFAYMSDDSKIENPRFFRKEENELGKAQRKLDKVSKKDKNNRVLNLKDKVRLKTKKVISRIHERITFKRENFTHQESRKIINKYQIICVEDLDINKMKEHSFRCLSKSISDASWSMFLNLLHVKAVDAGRVVVKVNPAYTSQDCSKCGHREKKSLSTRQHNCKCCGLSINRDLNASLNILRIGLDSLGIQSLEAPML